MNLKKVAAKPKLEELQKVIPIINKTRLDRWINSLVNDGYVLIFLDDPSPSREDLFQLLIDTENKSAMEKLSKELGKDQMELILNNAVRDRYAVIYIQMFIQSVVDIYFAKTLEELAKYTKWDKYYSGKKYTLD